MRALTITGFSLAALGVLTFLVLTGFSIALGSWPHFWFALLSLLPTTVILALSCIAGFVSFIQSLDS